MSLRYKQELEAAGGEEAFNSFASPFRMEVTDDIGGPSMTRQEFSEECDINVLMARYEKTGIWPLPPNEAVPKYVDFTAMPDDLQGMMQQVLDAQDAFMKLPAHVRKEFDNDALRFVEYAQDRDNLEQMREWGLAEPEKAPEAPIKVEVVGAPGAPEKAPAEPGA